jgi:ABC-type transport system involved in multi-copper enzyme maturation permease subunit
MFSQMYLVEQKKLFKGKLFWGALALLLAIGMSVFFFMYTTRNSTALSVEDQVEVTAAVIWPQSLYGGLLMMAQLGAPLLLAVVGAAVAQEYGWRTMSLWVSHGVPRSVVLLARFAALVLTVMIFTAVLFTAIALMSVFFTWRITGGFDPSVVNFGEVLLGILRTTYVLLPYVALTFLAGVLTRSMVGAIGSGVVFMIIVEPVTIEIMSALGGIFHQIRMFLPDFVATSVFNLNEAIAVSPFAEAAEDAPQLLAAGPAAALIALYTVLLMGLALWIFRRQDLSA